MSLQDSISTQQREIEVPSTKLSEALMLIRKAGGWAWKTDVSNVGYTIHIHWKFEVEKQQALI